MAVQSRYAAEIPPAPPEKILKNRAQQELCWLADDPHWGLRGQAERGALRHDVGGDELEEHPALVVLLMRHPLGHEYRGTRTVNRRAAGCVLVDGQLSRVYHAEDR